MKKLLGFISKKYKYLLSFILGGIIFGSSVYAVTIASNTVTYDNTNSGLTSTNVQGAIDELYNKSNTKISNYKATVGLYRNSNIVKVMKYDEDSTSTTYCITGEEATCEELAPITTTTYTQGTIVDYKVNNSATRRFYVLHDDGNKLTLQDQKNTVDNVAYATKSDFITAGGTEAEWNSCVYTDGNGSKHYGCGTKGPVTILPALESVTNGWTNVNLINYTPGITSFVGNNKTGCTSSACSENIYTMEEKSARARLISVPEAWNIGCKTEIEGSCPKYMYNYLNEANNYAGIIDGLEESWGYWTMNVYMNINYDAFRIMARGAFLQPCIVNSVDYGARAVIEINK